MYYTTRYLGIFIARDIIKLIKRLVLISKCQYIYKKRIIIKTITNRYIDYNLKINSVGVL